MIPAPLATLLAKPLVKYGVPVALIVLAIIAWSLWLSDVKEDAATQAVAQDRQEQLIETLNRVEQADETRRDVRDDRSRAAYDECVRSARNPAQCVRFLPE